ncbi:MAG: 7-cyano-7-deazaguanine synthase QueC [Planctomycetota bacterium]|nr:MAG: 7-cyano-7-deazaguanine synthase QueC [Planctomycetota bacterium]
MKYIILLSGGLDSAVNLAVASKEGEVVCALFFDYGQKARYRERFSAESLSKHYGCRLETIELPWLKEITDTALVEPDAHIPDVTADTLPEDVSAVWVPNRNGVFIAIAAAHAESMGADAVVAGFNREEGAIFPDNSPEFRKAAEAALGYSTLSGVKLVAFTENMDKKEIVGEGRKLGVPFDFIWPCYRGGETPCGKCESCVRYKRAME